MVNKVILVGNVGRDPEVRYLESGVAVANLPLATSETYTNKNGERITNTEWHNIVLWRKLAEVAEKWVKKGQALYIEGKIRSRSYEDKEGNKRYITEIVADNMQMLGKKTEDSAKTEMSEKGVVNEETESHDNSPEEPQSSTTSTPEYKNNGNTEDDLPF